MAGPTPEQEQEIQQLLTGRPPGMTPEAEIRQLLGEPAEEFGPPIPTGPKVFTPPKSPVAGLKLVSPMLPIPVDMNAAGWAIIKGIRDLGVGVASLPFDVAEIAGSERAGEISENINRAVPDIEVGGLGRAGAAGVQYGVPGLGASRLALGATKNASKFVQFFSEVAATVGSDIAVATTDDIETLGNMLGGPTAINEDDPAFIKRLKVGFETVPFATLPPAAINSTVWMWKKITGLIGGLLPSKKMSEEAAAVVLRELTSDPETAVKNIDKIIEEYRGRPFSPTTGPAADDPGLIATQRGFSSDPRFAARKSENQLAAARELAEVTETPSGVAADTGEFFARAREQKVAAFEETISGFENLQKQVQNELETYVGISQGFRNLAPDASSQLNKIVLDELKRMTAKKTTLYKAIDPGGTAIITKEDLYTAVVAAGKNSGKFDRTGTKVQSYFKQYDKLKKFSNPKGISQGPNKPNLHPKIAYRDIEDMRPDLSAAISKARADKEGGVVTRLLDLQDAFDRTVVDIAGGGDAAAKNAREALRFFKEEFAPRFREGVGGSIALEVRRAGPAQAIPPTTLAGRFVKIGAGSREPAQQLAKIINASPNKAEAQRALRDYTISVFSQTVVTPSGKLVPTAVDKFLEMYDEIITTFPDIGREIKEMGAGIKRRVKTESLLADEVKAARGELKLSEREMNKNITNLFIEQDPVTALTRVIKRSDPIRSFDELYEAAAKDKSGRASSGLKQAFKEYIDQTVVSSSVIPQAEERFIVVANKMEGLTKDKVTSHIMNKLFSEGERKVLQQVRDQMRLENRINQQVTVGAPTEPLRKVADRTRLILASYFGIVKGRGVFAITRWIQDITNKNPVTIAEGFLFDALLDPEIGRVMLLPATPANQKVAQRLFETHLINNILPELLAEEAD